MLYLQFIPVIIVIVPNPSVLNTWCENDYLADAKLVVFQRRWSPYMKRFSGAAQPPHFTTTVGFDVMI